MICKISGITVQSYLADTLHSTDKLANQISQSVVMLCSTIDLHQNYNTLYCKRTCFVSRTSYTLEHQDKS